MLCRSRRCSKEGKSGEGSNRRQIRERKGSQQVRWRRRSRETCYRKCYLENTQSKDVLFIACGIVWRLLERLRRSTVASHDRMIRSQLRQVGLLRVWNETTVLKPSTGIHGQMSLPQFPFLQRASPKETPILVQAPFPSLRVYITPRCVPASHNTAHVERVCDIDSHPIPELLLQ